MSAAAKVSVTFLARAASFDGAVLFQIYLTVNLLIVAAFLTSTAIRFLKFTPARELKLNYLALGSIFAFAGLTPALPSARFFEPPAKIWMDASPGPARSGPAAEAAAPSISVGTIGDLKPPGSTPFYFFFLAIAALLVADAYRLARAQKGSIRLRRIGKVEIRIGAKTSVPFSYRTYKTAYVVLPQTLHPNQHRIAIAHELQHHRQHDTKWVYAQWLLTRLNPLNPAVWLWTKRINEIQEFACDGALVNQRKIEPRAYASCLVEVAQSALHARRLPVGATGMMGGGQGHILKRRIESMFNKQQAHRMGKTSALAAVLITVAAMGAAAFAGKGILTDRRITMEQAKQMAAKMKANGSEFPLQVNEDVLGQLNYFLATEEGRTFIKGALSRMDERLDRIKKSGSLYKMPAEILAIPIVESGYQNLKQKPGSKSKGAGIWQWIPASARRFGLVVDMFKDERLDIPRSTKAAFEYMQANYDRFDGDWLLAVQAFNSGEANVEKAIFSSGSRDAWELIRWGLPTDRDYLARAVAAMLIVGNREILE